MQETVYSVSEAVKILEIKLHVLRYWEDEMKIPVQRMRWDTDTTPDMIFRFF